MAVFFQTVVCSDIIELTDLLIRRYGCIDSVRMFDISELCELIGLAKEDERKKEIKAEWNALLPYMYMDRLKMITFTEYYDRRTGKGIDWRPVEEIEREIAEAHGGAV